MNFPRMKGKHGCFRIMTRVTLLLNFGAVLMGLQGAGTGMLDRGIEKYKREEELWEMKASASQSNPLAYQLQILQLLD